MRPYKGLSALALASVTEAAARAQPESDDEAFRREVPCWHGGNYEAALKIATKLEPGLLLAARDWQALPGRPKSASNMDLLSMNAARFTWAYTLLIDQLGCPQAGEDAVGAQQILACKYPVVLHAFEASSEFYSMFESHGREEMIRTFHEDWIKSSFARLEVSHKLAAALALTDVPADIDVRAPWPAWSLVLPDGLFSAPDGDNIAHAHQIARVWCLGTSPIVGWCTNAEIMFDLRPELHKLQDRLPSTLYLSICNLIRGASLALSNPSEFKKQTQSSGSSSSKRIRHAPPQLEQARFMLSAPVNVDLREHLSAVLSGVKGASPTVQFLVRGHWRNQACGPRQTLRKPLWIQPFWKGPEGSRILLRQHRVSEEIARATRG